MIDKIKKFFGFGSDAYVSTMSDEELLSKALSELPAEVMDTVAQLSEDERFKDLPLNERIGLANMVTFRAHYQAEKLKKASSK